MRAFRLGGSSWLGLAGLLLLIHSIQILLLQ
uniref:Uncharacterized protein n=1 Tax=Setaria italica TaxID=4555 RepID=K3ZFS9_SETIT